MSDPKPIKNKRGLARLLMLAGGVLVLLGGGVAGGIALVSTGMLGAGEAKLGDKAHAAPEKTGESSYYAIEQGFTANLRDSGAFVQASVAVSSRGDPQVPDAVKANEPAMRSVILQTLAEQDYAAISTPEGKKALLANLRDALNAELRAKVGSGGIDNVYFTAFVLQ